MQAKCLAWYTDHSKPFIPSLSVYGIHHGLGLCQVLGFQQWTNHSQCLQLAVNKTNTIMWDAENIS